MNRARLRTILKSKITENYFFYSLDYGLRIVVQLGYFAIISRSLGAAGYGIFASISAISILAAVFSGLGSEQVLVRRAAGEPAAFPDAFGHTLICIACSIVPVSAICFLVLQFMNTGGIAWWAVVLFVMSETLFTKLTYLANACFMAHEVAGRQFVINITVSSVKLAGAALAWKPAAFPRRRSRLRPGRDGISPVLGLALLLRWRLCSGSWARRASLSIPAIFGTDCSTRLSSPPSWPCAILTSPSSWKRWERRPAAFTRRLSAWSIARLFR